jgi:hypothetical protein
VRIATAARVDIYLLRCTIRAVEMTDATAASRVYSFCGETVIPSPAVDATDWLQCKQRSKPSIRPNSARLNSIERQRGHTRNSRRGTWLGQLSSKILIRHSLLNARPTWPEQSSSRSSRPWLFRFRYEIGLSIVKYLCGTLGARY